MSDKSEDEDIPMMATGLDRTVTTPELNENYVNYSVMLPRGNTYVREKVIERKRDASRYSFGRRNDIPILYTCGYRVDFDDGKANEMTANVIAESMYSTCDDSGNEYLMME